MSDAPRQPEPPQRLPPPGSDPTAAPSAPGREVLTTGLLLLLFLGLAGWHLWGDRTRPRPTEMRREPILRTLDLNRASRTELLQLPGLGPALAEKILSHRHLNGPFRRLDELKEVHGVGEIVFAKLRPHFVLGDSSSEERVDDDLDPEPLRLSRKIEPKNDPVVHVAQKPNPDGLIDVNHAPTGELEKLPGIGPILAKRIAEERDQKPFARVEDLKRVNGIGVKKAEALRNRILFGTRE
jgi:competence protein ComEA